MTIYKNSIAAAVFTAIAAPAFAGGFAEPAPAIVVPAPAPIVAPAPQLTWTGPSVGVRLGYGALDTDVGAASFDDYGPIYGLSANYDLDLGTAVVGAGVSVDGTNIDVNGADIEYIARIGARVGADFGQSLVYGTAGYAKAFTDGGGLGDSDGYYAGIGSEIRLTETLTLGSEILYHQFDDFDVPAAETDALTANLSLNLRF